MWDWPTTSSPIIHLVGKCPTHCKMPLITPSRILKVTIESKILIWQTNLFWLYFRGTVKAVPDICSAYSPYGQFKGLFCPSGKAPFKASVVKWFPNPLKYSRSANSDSCPPEWLVDSFSLLPFQNTSVSDMSFCRCWAICSSLLSRFIFSCAKFPDWMSNSQEIMQKLAERGTAFWHVINYETLHNIHDKREMAKTLLSSCNRYQLHRRSFSPYDIRCQWWNSQRQ